MRKGHGKPAQSAKTRRRVYDEAWKKVLDLFFWDFLDFYFPDLYIQIDKEQGYTFLDQELEKIAPQAKSKRRRLDRLAKVFLKNKGEVWILIHVEVQISPEEDFSERMFSYYYRIYDRYQKPLASLAILGDSKVSYRPKSFEIKALGEVFVHFKFITSKLLDWRGKEEDLWKMKNPFALVTLASLKAKEKNLRNRFVWKVDLTAILYEKGYSEEMIKGLYWFLDGIMVLPEDMEIEYNDEISKIEKEKKMPYITTAERIGIQKGIQKGREEGLQKGIQKGREEGIQKGREEGIQKGREEGIQKGIQEAIETALEIRFGAIGLACMKRILEIDDLEKLRTLLKTATRAEDIEKFQREI